MASDGDKSGLLRELRIDRAQREGPAGGRRGVRIALIVLLFFYLARPLLNPTGLETWLGSGGRTSQVVLLDDSLRLATHDRVEVHTWEDMPHVFPPNVGLFEASDVALDLIATFVRTELA